MTRIEHALERLKASFLELSDLAVCLGTVCRIAGLDEAVCRAVLTALEHRFPCWSQDRCFHLRPESALEEDGDES